MAIRNLIILSVLLTGCATTNEPAEWDPESLESKTVTLHILDREEWIEFQSARMDCDPDSCGMLAYEIGATAFWSGGPDGATEDNCHIYIPAYRGVPSYRTITHELRHCYQGAHSTWK